MTRDRWNSTCRPRKAEATDTADLRLLVLPDLHLDRWIAAGRDPLDHLTPDDFAGVDLCILGGDLTNEAINRWPRVFGWLAERVEPSKTFAFEGNHDYYFASIDDRGRHAEIAAAHGVGYAQMGEIVRGDHRFLCTTLWTNFELHGDPRGAMVAAERLMNDYTMIRAATDDHSRLRPEHTARIHVRHRAWLEAKLTEDFDGETTVVTHHAPHRSCVPPAVANGPAYASDLSKMIEQYRPARWLYGHTHIPHRTTVGVTDLRCCSVGYPYEDSRGRLPSRQDVIVLPQPHRRSS
ncbi:metallophosphoesterase [Jannaschia formosa]|uniref:metallophosphoesterase n=1 Tax=Jannaschia formosa TaxID=2259592 RepID=UPI0014319200|nr:metallophosphoesterase [Jannaschia formosa]